METNTRQHHGDYSQAANMTSVISTPKRGPWGDAKFRGNCDGTLFRNLVLRYQPRRVADPMMGSGTTRDVIADLNRKGQSQIEFWGGDLRDGFDLQLDPLPSEFDLIWVHPPYWNMIRYSDDPRDLSSYEYYDDFVLALQRCLRQCYHGLIKGGRLAVLVGDLRRKGKYTPIVRDVMNMEGPLGELRSVIIKTQHNCTSGNKQYGRLRDARIAHEYCVIFAKE